MRLKHFLSVFLTLLTLSVGQMWGAKITDYTKIVNGKEYYIGATTSSTDYYWSSPQTTTGTDISGTAVTSKASATIVILEGSGTSWKIKIKGTSNYVTLTNSKKNGKFNIATTSNNWTFSNASSLIKMLYVGSYCLQKNNSGTQFGSYANTQTNVWLEEAGSGCDKKVSLAQSVTNGSATFSLAGPVETCSETASDRQVSVSITPTTGYALTSGPTVSGVANATISGSGPYTIQLPQNGNGTLTLNATCTAIAVTGVSLNKNSTSIVEGSTETLTATIAPANALDQAVTWYSNAEGVATVSNSGVVTAVATGNATITVTTHDGGFSASCTVTVTALPKDHFIDEVQGTVVADKTSAYNFSSVTIGDKSEATSGSCEQQHYHFVGWITKAKYDAGTSISDSDIQSGNKTPNNSTYYAVWAKGSGGNYTESVSWDSRYNTTTEVEGSELTIEENVTVTHNKGTNNTTCKFYTTGPGIRVYGGGNFVVTAPSALSSITLTFGSGEGSNAITANVGTYSNGAWTGNATSVTFSVGGTTGHRRIAGISATYGSVSYSDYIAKCCQPLASINGSVSVTNQTVSWSAVTDASGYKVKVGTGDWSDIGNVTSKTFDLPCGGDTYNVYVMAYNTNNAGHCTGDGPESNAIQVTSAACTEPAITVDPNALTGLNYIVNAGPSAAQSFNVKGSNLTGALTVKANDNYEICLTNSATADDWKSGATTLSIAQATAEGNAGQNVYVRLKSGKAVGDYNSNTIKVYGGGIEEASAVTVTVSGSVLKPTIMADPTSISDWSTQTGSAPNPATKTITVTGVNLKADISASLTAGGDYFTITPSGLAQSEGSVNGSVVIGVKAAAYASAATREGTLRLSTTDGDNVDVAISLTVADDPREQFTLLTKSNLSQLGDDARLVLVYNGLLNHYAAKAGYISSNGYDEVTEDAENEFEISGNTLYAAEENHLLILTLGEMENGFSLYDGNKYLSNGTSNKIGNSDDAVAWTIAVDDDGYAIITCTTGQQQIIKYNTSVSSGAYFRAYAASAGSTAYVNAYFKASTTPKVNISGTLNAFTYMRDQGPSTAQSFKVSGNNLSENLVVTAPTNYEVCKTENGSYTASVEFTPSEGSVAQSDVYIRLKASLAINSYNGDITVSSTGATNATKAVTGSVTTPVYTVTLNTNGGTIEDGHDVTSYTEGVGATLPTAEYISKSGFSFEGWYANSDLTTGGVQTTIATNATGAKEYWAKWTELPGYDITWLVDGEAYTGGEPDVHVVYNGSISKLPSTPTSLDITSKTFVGWTTAPVNEKQANAPTPLYTAANQIPGNITENKIFYAVFAQETHSGTFTKVTDASTLAAGDRLLIHSNNYAAGTIGSNNYLTRESVTFTNSDITNKGNASVWVLGGTSGEWTFTSDEGTLKCTGTSNNNLSLSTGVATWTITLDNNSNATICNTTYTNYIRYNGSAGRFSTYTSSGSTPQLYREGTSLNDYTTKFVKPIAVTGVTLNKNATTLAINGSETLTATVAPQNATNKNVSWSSNATGIATVEAGVVTAVAAGEATITVTTEDGSFTDECVVTVLPTVETPTFSPAAGAINKGSKVEILCATEDATILYSLDGSDPSVAYPEGGVAINANCTLKAKATKENYTTSAVASAAYTIIKASQTVSFAESAISFRLESDEYDAFTGQTASSTYGSAVITYASSNTSVAVVDENTGAVTLQGVKGTTTITATAAEDEDYQSASATYTITVLRAGVVRTGDFTLVTNANQLADGDYILIAGPTGYQGSTPILKSLSTSSSGITYQTKTVANDEITYAQFLTEGNEAKIITLEKAGDYWAFNFGTDADLYISAGTGTSGHDLSSESTISDKEKWTITVNAESHVATVLNVGNTTAGKLLCNSSSSQFRSYSNNSTSGTLYIYKQKDKNKEPQTLSFATPSYEFPLNESAYTSFAHQTVSGAHTAVTYTTSNSAVAAINNNTVVLNGGVGTATITASAAEDDDYNHASATYTITVTAALNTVTFHYYKPADATADQTALKELTSGAGITVPANPTNVGEYTFVGWAPATLVETQSAPNNLVAALQAGATYHPATSEDYYAIYRRLENSDGRFYLMHEVSSTPNYAKAPASSTSTNFQNTTDIAEAAIFEITEDNKLFYYEGNTPRYFSSTSTTERNLDFTTNAEDAQTWTITESGTTTTFYSSISSKYFAHNNTMWAAYASGSINQANQSKDLKQVYLAHVYYSSTPNLMVSPVLTWAQGNATHVMEIEETYDNSATATVGGEPVSVSYSSSDPEKATVSNAGVVTAHLGGLVTITATVAENPGVSRQLVETYQVSITKKVPQITFAASIEADYKYKVFVGEAYKKDLSENVTIVSDGAVSYSLSNNATSSEYASINASTGVVTGLSSNGSAIQYMFVRTAETDMYQPGEANHIFYVLSLKNQALAFDQNAYVFDMNESVDVFTNTLSGVQTSATFASNNTDVAEVDAASGEVTVHTNVCGTATITATAAEGQVGDEVYKEVSQAYTITVNYPKPTFSMESSEIKAPVSLAISGYDENTKLFWTDGEGDPNTPYSEPLAISATKTIRAKATNADGSLVSPIASVTLTKVTPTVVGSQEGGTITLNADEGSLITYIIENGNHVIVASGEDVPAPVVFETEMSDTYNVVAYATWDVEGGFSGSEYEHDFVVKAKGHLPISYTGDGSGLAEKDWASIVGSLGNYGNDPKIQFKNEGCALIAAFVEQPVQLSYDIKHMAANNNAWETTSNVYSVQWSADGETYNDIVVYNASHPISKDEITSESFELNPSARYIKWTYNTKTQSTGGNVALGNIRITCEAVVIDGVSVVDIPEGYDGDVVVENGVTWKPVNNGHQPEIHNLWVKQGAVVDLDEATLEVVNNFFIEAQDGYSGQIIDPTVLAVNGNAYYDLTLNTTGTMDHNKWYSFAVPFKVDAATGIQRLSNDGKTSNAGFNSHYRLLKYNSSLRANTGNGWEYMTKGETLDPGKFYMIAMNSNEYNRVRMTKKAGENINNAGNIAFTITGTGLQDNWNALANNALYYANVGATGTGNGSLKVQVYDPIEKGYDALGFGEVTFTVGTPFFIQVAGAGEMTIVAAGSSVHDALHAPAYRTESTEEFQLRLGADTESYYDQLYVSASDEALDSYQIGHDLAKAGVSTTVPQMYIEAYGGKLCDAEFPLVNNEATFPLTFTIPTAGTYQLYLAAAPENANLYLQKNGVTVWDMTAGAYALEIESGTNTDYSLLLQIKEDTSTGVGTMNAETGAQKVVINEKVFILRGGKMYDVTGKAVR